jgi:uncharacterized protein (DUF983 family)
MVHSERSGVPMIHACITSIEMNLPEMENVGSLRFLYWQVSLYFLPFLQVISITTLNIIKSLVICAEVSCYT